MPELICKSDTIVESIAMKRILEGLIHNMNTPLNLIVGYAQQLKKQHPELRQAETILNAGLNIDDVLHACLRQLDLRNKDDVHDIQLNDWLLDEMQLLKNVLEIKRNVNLELEMSACVVNIPIPSLLLSVMLETIILAVVRQKPLDIGLYAIKFVLKAAPSQAELWVELPLSMNGYGLTPSDVWDKVNACFELDVREVFPIQIEAENDVCLVLKFPLSEHGRQD